LTRHYRRQRRIVKAVIDTSTLLNVLILHLIEKSPESHRQVILETSKLSSYLSNNPSQQQSFIQLFRSIPTVLTTSHVMAEINGLLKQSRIKRERYRAFWTHGMQLLHERALDERASLRLLDMFINVPLNESVCTLGPVDTALIQLASRGLRPVDR
jgi:rRNA-processing protein FCF1